MPVSTYAEGTATLAGIDVTLGTAGDTTPGAYQVFLDTAAMTTWDELKVMISEKATSTSTERLVLKEIITGRQTEPIWASPPLILLNGWSVKLNGYNDIPWSIRKA